MASSSAFSQGQLRAAEVVQVTKAHGRIEGRELWWVQSQELGLYLAQEFKWPALQVAGLIRRSRRPATVSQWESQETTIWISSCSPDRLSARQAACYLQGHWTIENSVFWVRDVSYDEDRLHGRAIALLLSLLRNAAINLIRREGYRFIPDGWRSIASRPDRGLPLLLKILKR